MSVEEHLSAEAPEVLTGGTVTQSRHHKRHYYRRETPTPTKVKKLNLPKNLQSLAAAAVMQTASASEVLSMVVV